MFVLHHEIRFVIYSYFIVSLGLKVNTQRTHLKLMLFIYTRIPEELVKKKEL